MRNDNTTATLRDILFSIAVTNDEDIQEKVLTLLDDFRYLGKVEKELLNKYKQLAEEVNGVPKQGTLVARDQDYSLSRVIQADSLIDYTKIYIRNVQNIQMDEGIRKSLKDYYDGKIKFEDLSVKVQDALMVGSPNETSEEMESNLDIDYFKKLTEQESIPKGVKFGIPCIDEVYRGLVPGDILTIAGYTGSMKTTLASNLAYNAMKEGKNVLYISLEVSRDDLMFALLSRFSFTDYTKPIMRNEIQEFATKNKKEFLELCNEYNKLEGNIRIVDEKDLNTYSITAFNELIEKINEEFITRTGKKTDIIVLDHVQLLKFNDSKSAMDNPYLVVNYYTSYFREKAAREGYAVILVSQTSRQGYEYACKNNGRYLETGLAEANELERASTCIVTIFVTDRGKQSKEVSVQVLKNRYGEKMEEPSQASMYAEYFLIGNGNSLNVEEVGPVFNDNEFIDTKEFNLDEILGGM